MNFRNIFFFLGLFSLLILTGCASVTKAGKEKNQRFQGNAGNASSVKDNTALFIEAHKQKLLGNLSEAIKMFIACLEIDPNDDASMYELAQLLMLSNQTEQSLRYAEKAVGLSPENIWYRLLYARILNKSGRYADAADVYKKLVADFPDNLEYVDMLALAYLFAGKTEDAIGVYNRLEEKFGINEEISLKKQSIFIQENQLDNAIREIEKLVLFFPEEFKYYAILAELYLTAGYENKALETYNKIIEIDPQDPYIYISLADLYRRKGETDKAFEYLLTGFANPNLSIENKLQIIISYYSNAKDIEDMYAEAFRLSEILVETHPASPEAYSIYGDFLAQDNRFVEAKDAFNKVLSIDSSRYYIWEQLLLVESELEDYPSMINVSERALELFPEQTLLYLFKGSAHYMLKQWNECIETLEKGLFFLAENQLMSIQFYTYLGDAYHQILNSEKSDESYEKVLALDPDNDYALNNYAYYLSLRGAKLEQAAEMAKKATGLKPGNSANQDTYGWVLYKLGEYDEAEKWIRKALDSGGDTNPVILEHYGDVLYKLGRKEDAVEYWHTADEHGKGSDFLQKKLSDKTLYE